MMKSHVSGFAVLLIMALVCSGCGHTYPKERTKESIIDLCKKEYKIDVKVTTVGETIGIYIPLEDLIDFTFAISKKASERINDVILSVTRVAISTDAKFDFYCIIAHDVRIPEIQIIIIKSIDDVKRFLLSDISRGEYSKRMIVDMRLSPQAQKEKAIKEIFDKMKLDATWQEDVLNDFFRTEPSELSDIGYWNGKFYMKDITLAEFLAEQIAARVRLEFRDDKELSNNFLIRSSKGVYRTTGEERFFVFEVNASAKDVAISPGSHSNAVLKKTIDIVSYVLHAYHYTDFDYVDIADQKEMRIVRVSREDLENYRQKKLKFEDILAASQVGV